MNHQKVVQSLKQIFDKYGTDIVRKPNNFRSAIFDLLDEWNYKEERLVLRNAIESNALLSLVTANPITSDTTATALEQLKKAGHLTEEDAEFITKCFIAARGGDPNIVTENIKKQQAETEQKRQEEENHQEKEREQQDGSKQQSNKKIGVIMVAVVALFIIIGLIFSSNKDNKNIPSVNKETKLCGVCYGTGIDSSGNICINCMGTGRVE